MNELVVTRQIWYMCCVYEFNCTFKAIEFQLIDSNLSNSIIFYCVLSTFSAQIVASFQVLDLTLFYGSRKKRSGRVEFLMDLYALHSDSIILFYNRLWMLSSTWSDGLWFSIIIVLSKRVAIGGKNFFRNLCNDVDGECMDMDMPVHRIMGENIFLPFRFTHNFVKTNQFFLCRDFVVLCR